MENTVGHIMFRRNGKLVRKMEFQSEGYRNFYGAIVDDPIETLRKTAVHAVAGDPGLTATTHFVCFNGNTLPGLDKWHQTGYRHFNGEAEITGWR